MSCLIDTALNLPLLKAEQQLNNIPRPEDKLLFMKHILLELPEIIINVIFVMFFLKPKLYSTQRHFDNDWQLSSLLTQVHVSAAGHDVTNKSLCFTHLSHVSETGDC